MPPYNKVLKFDITNTYICEIIGFDEIFRKGMIKNARLQKISALLPFRGWDIETFLL